MRSIYTKSNGIRSHRQDANHSLYYSVPLRIAEAADADPRWVGSRSKTQAKL
jgi:hypothetical protein